jgi:hypothetical protein
MSKFNLVLVVSLKYKIMLQCIFKHKILYRLIPTIGKNWTKNVIKIYEIYNWCKKKPCYCCRSLAVPHVGVNMPGVCTDEAAAANNKSKLV